MAAEKRTKKNRSEGAGGDLSERYLKAKTEKIELEVEAKRGEFVRVDEVKGLLREIAAVMKERLEGIPQMLARKLSTIKDPAEIEALLKKEISAVLQELNRQETRGYIEADDEGEEERSERKRPEKKSQKAKRAMEEPEEDEEEKDFNPYGDDDD